MSRDTLHKLMRFVLVGGFNTGLAFLVWKALLALGVHYLAVSAISWAIGVGVSYVLNRSFTFQRTDKPQIREFAAFVSGYLLQLGVGSVSLFVLMGVLKLDENVAFVCNVAITTAVSFAFMHWGVFRKPAHG